MDPRTRADRSWDRVVQCGAQDRTKPHQTNFEILGPHRTKTRNRPGAWIPVLKIANITMIILLTHVGDGLCCWQLKQLTTSRQPIFSLLVKFWDKLSHNYCVTNISILSPTKYCCNKCHQHKLLRLIKKLKVIGNLPEMRCLNESVSNYLRYQFIIIVCIFVSNEININRTCQTVNYQKRWLLNFIRFDGEHK